MDPPTATARPLLRHIGRPILIIQVSHTCSEPNTHFLIFRLCKNQIAKRKIEVLVSHSHTKKESTLILLPGKVASERIQGIGIP